MQAYLRGCKRQPACKHPVYVPILGSNQLKSKGKQSFSNGFRKTKYSILLPSIVIWFIYVNKKTGGVFCFMYMLLDFCA